MTRDDAITVTEMILANWVRPEWTDAQIAAFVNALVPYDADLATQAVALAHREISFRPSFADLMGFYRSARADAASRQHPPRTAPQTKNSLPLWVKRWVAARFLYARFGRDQDMRVFPEQREWVGPEEPLMPLDEWVREAEAISDRDALRAVAS